MVVRIDHLIGIATVNIKDIPPQSYDYNTSYLQYLTPYT